MDLLEAKSRIAEALVESIFRRARYQIRSVENQRGDRSVFLMARRNWPNLYFVLVTDRPEPGRSCFQAFPLAAWHPGEPFRTVDLVALKELRIFQHNGEDHEELIRRIFGLLSGASL